MRSLISWTIISHATITIFFLDGQPFTNVLGLVTKAMEVALIILLVDSSEP
jgi:hypothetical protein